MSDARNRGMVEVEILGEIYNLTSETSPEYTRQVAKHVDETAREITQESGVVDGKKVAILTAIAVTDQLFRMRDGVDVVKRLAESRAEHLAAEVISFIDPSAGT